MRIAVYCSSRENLPANYAADAAAIGRCIAKSGATMIYGGLSIGMMKVVADAAKAEGGRAVGVVPINRKHLINPINDENVLTLDLNDRKAKLELMSDLFVVLPGGYGTLDEMISTFSFLTFTGDTHKPLIVLNTDGIYDPTFEQFRLMVDRKLLDPTILDRIVVVNTANECAQTINRFVQQH